MTGKRKAKGKAKRKASKARRNPTLAILGNPRGARRLAHRVYEVRYLHAANGKPYKHSYKPGAGIVLLKNGDVLLTGERGQRLWNTYLVPGDE